MVQNSTTKSANKGKTPRRKTKSQIDASFVKDTLKWLSELFIEPQVDLTYLNAIVDQLFRVKETRGIKECITYSKSLRLETYKLISDMDDLTKIRTIPRKEVPRRLRFLRSISPELIPTQIKLLLTLTYCTRAFRLPPDPDLSSIINPPDTNYQSESVFLNIRAKSFWARLGHRHINGRPPSSVRFRGFHLSTKSSPSYGNATSMALLEYCSGAIDLIQDSIRTVGGSKIAGIFDKLALLKSEGLAYDFHPLRWTITKLFDICTNGKWRNRKPVRARRLAALSDKEGKTRVVAILDYWSQTVLKPLHHYLFKCLQQIPQDCTFDQGSFINKLKHRPGHRYYSFDLKSATDRFPIDVICSLLEPKFGKAFVKAWRSIMVGLPFSFAGKEYSYSCGNPMGAYSSWNSFALAHHFVLYHCCCDLGIIWNKAPYVLLGDDLVIHDNYLAEHYHQVMTKLGVKISLEKSHVSPYCYEFAKRFVHNGVELTPFPINSLWESRKVPTLLLSLLTQEVRKGWISSSGIPLAVLRFLEIRRLPRSYRTKVKQYLFPAFYIQEAIGKRMTAEECIMHTLRSLSLDNLIPILDSANQEYFIPHLGQDAFNRMLRICTLMLFRESFEKKKKGRPLGQLSEDLVLLYTSAPEYTRFQDLSELIYCTPLLGVYGQIESSYLQVLKDTYSLDYFRMGEWSLTMRALCLPLSDEVFFHKTKELPSRVSGKLASALIHVLTGINSSPSIIWYGTSRYCNGSRDELFKAIPRLASVWYAEDIDLDTAESTVDSA